MKNEGDTRIHEANASIFTVTFLAHLDKHGYVFVFLFLASAQDNVFFKIKNSSRVYLVKKITKFTVM